jgi:hypothetical protein
MAGDGGVVAEDGILDDHLAGAHGLEEVPQQVAKSFGFSNSALSAAPQALWSAVAKLPLSSYGTQSGSFAAAVQVRHLTEARTVL